MDSHVDLLVSLGLLRGCKQYPTALQLLQQMEKHGGSAMAALVGLQVFDPSIPIPIWTNMVNPRVVCHGLSMFVPIQRATNYSTNCGPFLVPGVIEFRGLNM